MVTNFEKLEIAVYNLLYNLDLHTFRLVEW